MRKLLFIWTLFFGLSSLAQEAETLIDTNRILIGGQVKVSLMLTTKAQDSVQWPLISDTLLTEIEVLSRSGIDTAYDSQDISTKLYTQDLLITSFDFGYYAVPPFEFMVNGKKVKTNAFLLYVGSVPLDTADAIRDIKDIMPVEYGFLDWLSDNWLWLGSTALIAILVILVLRYWLKKRKEKPAEIIVKPTEPAHSIALRKLKELEAQRLWQNSKTKAFHSELTEIIREYLELRFSIHALEQTSDEIMLSLRFSDISEAHKAQLKQILFLADLVKFAKEKPLPEENEDSLKKAYDFVEATKQEAEPKASKKELTKDV